MYRTILVPLDGSTLAEAALPHAMQLAKTFKAELILLRVAVLPILPEVDTDAIYQSLESESEAYLSDVLDRMRTDDLRIRKIVSTGKAAEAIIEQALQNRVSVVAMATHGHSGVGQWPLGSVAERVLHSMQVPVLLIRTSPEAAQP